jgi:hypothetical protein
MYWDNVGNAVTLEVDVNVSAATDSGQVTLDRMPSRPGFMCYPIPVPGYVV